MLVCQKHLCKGINMLQVPHVMKVDSESFCSFCDKKAVFEVYYFYIHSRKEAEAEIQVSS